MEPTRQRRRADLRAQAFLDITSKYGGEARRVRRAIAFSLARRRWGQAKGRILSVISTAVIAALSLLGLTALAAQPARAQGSRKDDIVLNSRGLALAGATVRVCTTPASGQPCTPLAQIYSDAALTQALANPTTTDGMGNYTFYAAPGKYMIEISGPGITTRQMANVILPSDPTAPSFSSLSSSGGISAFSLNLGGNLSVGGSATVTGAANLNAGGALAGTFSGNPAFSGVPSFGAYGTTGAGTHSGTETFGGDAIFGKTPWFDIRYFGGACDNSTDNTAAFNSALSAAQTAGGGVIYFPLGACLFNSKPSNIGNGVKLKGQGWNTNTLVGTTLIRNYADATTNGFITFDGSFSTAQGTGSGIDDMSIGPATGQTNGYLVKLTSKPGCTVGADCDNHRASDTHLTNVGLFNGNGGTSNCALYIDGSQNTTSGGQGIRLVNLNNVRISSTTGTNCSIYANNVAHLFISNTEIDAGFGGTPGITITGTGAAPSSTASAIVLISNLELSGGNLVIDSASGVQTSGSVFVGGNTSMSANTSDSILMGRFATTPTNSSVSSTWVNLLAATQRLQFFSLCVGTAGCSGGLGDASFSSAATAGTAYLGGDGTVALKRTGTNTTALTNSLLFVGSATGPSFASPGDIAAIVTPTSGSVWFGSDNLGFVQRDASGNINVGQKLGFRAGTGFGGYFTAPLTSARTWTLPDVTATVVLDTATQTLTNKTLTSPVLTGATNGTGLQLFNSATTCTTGATVGAICTTAAITLPVAYADTNYRLSCTGQGPTNVPIVQTYAKSNTTFTITIAALTAAAATFTSYDCSAVHN